MRLQTIYPCSAALLRVRVRPIALRRRSSLGQSDQTPLCVPPPMSFTTSPRSLRSCSCQSRAEQLAVPGLVNPEKLRTLRCSRWHTALHAQGRSSMQLETATRCREAAGTGRLAGWNSFAGFPAPSSTFGDQVTGRDVEADPDLGLARPQAAARCRGICWRAAGGGAVPGPWRPGIPARGARRAPPGGEAAREEGSGGRVPRGTRRGDIRV